MLRLAYLTTSTEIGCFCPGRNIIKREGTGGDVRKRLVAVRENEMAQEEGEIKSLY